LILALGHKHLPLNADGVVGAGPHASATLHAGILINVSLAAIEVDGISLALWNAKPASVTSCRIYYSRHKIRYMFRKIKSGRF